MDESTSEIVSLSRQAASGGVILRGRMEMEPLPSLTDYPDAFFAVLRKPPDRASDLRARLLRECGSALPSGLEPHEKVVQGELDPGAEGWIRRIRRLTECASQPIGICRAAAHESDHCRFKDRNMLALRADRMGQFLDRSARNGLDIGQLRDLLLDRFLRRLRHLSNLPFAIRGWWR
ncbi:hypothetical protein P2H44_22785 [Albimonas sp. CAU 1670]|uniref:hypothetical protein n=1 Tax=Albimonas sp. CAU 1670 TaxID=3032599 RepID=UPI0023DB39C4|nr:hypothetical protein [Albimonas sp. CAU 1670]MDF2235392.1 hypothetical protein [Albimonas sp. CAU 1670]